MTSRGILILIVATVVLVAAAAASAVTGGRTVSVAPPDQPALPGLAADPGSLAWVRIVRGPMKADFAQIGGRWAVVEKGNYPADEARMRRLLVGLADLTLVEPKTQRPELFPRLDLDDPSNGKATEVTVQDRMGKVLGQLIVGRSRPDRLGIGTDGVYVRRVGDNRAWLARGSLDVSGGIVDWLNPHIFSVPAGRIATMILTGGDGGVLVIGRQAATEPFAVESAPSGAKLKANAALAAPAAALESFDLIDVKPLADQPIPDDGVASAAFTTFDGLTLRLKVFEKDKMDWVVLAASSAKPGVAAEAKAVNDRAGKWAFAIPPGRAKLLRTRLADLLAPEGGS